MTDNHPPASHSSLGSGDDEPRVAAGTIPPAHDWARTHVSITEGNKVTLTPDGVEALDPDTRIAVHDASRTAGHHPSTCIIGSIARRRTNPDGWGYSCTHQDPLVDESRMYTTALTAAYACAIHVVSTRSELQRFDANDPLPLTPTLRPAQPPRSEP